MGRVPLLLPPSCCLVGALMIDDLSVAEGRHDVMLLGDRWFCRAEVRVRAYHSDNRPTTPLLNRLNHATG